MSNRVKRKIAVKPEIPTKLPRKWTDEEMEALLTGEMQYGHKNLDKIQERLPGRTIENIKTFLRTVHDTAGKINKDYNVIDYWIRKCEVDGSPWRDCIQIAQVLKYLSVDGLLENHPLPERCQGIDFRQAYRLLYEVVMGYPIQPVNQPTADFVAKALAELRSEVKKHTDAIKNVNLFLESRSQILKPTDAPVEPKKQNPNIHLGVKKPIKVYERKKKVTNSGDLPSLKITIKEKDDQSDSKSDFLKDFSVIVEGSTCTQSSTLNVPVAPEVEVDENELELLESFSYNPFKIPRKWLEEPLYVNLIQKI